MYYQSYYDKIYKFLSKNNDEDDNLENIPFTSQMDPQIYGLIKENNEKEKDPKYLHQKFKEDMPKLERYYKDHTYKKELESSSSETEEYLSHIIGNELNDLYGLDRLVKKKLEIPENSTIKYEKVKCCKNCDHQHKYFYAYFWDSNSKRLKKKYIGKNLPHPFSFNITMI